MSTNTPRPATNLGYPIEPHGRISSFDSIVEEAEFCDTHDFTDFKDLTEPVELTVGPELRRDNSVPTGASAASEPWDDGERDS